MSDNQNQLAVTTSPKASDQLATFLGIEKGMMLETLKAQCFKNKRPDEVSDAQLAAFVSTANVLQVNPLVPGMLYAYPERNGGITPILGPDGVFKKLDEHIAAGKLTGFECEVVMLDGKPDHADAIIYRAEGQKPAKYTAYFSEWSVTSNPNWQARPRHMLWVRAIKQAARQVIHGLPMDADEYEIAQMQNVTGTAETVAAPDRPAPKPRSPKGAAIVKENAKPVEVVIPAETVQAPANTTEPAANPIHAEANAIIAEANAKVEAAKVVEPAKPEPAKPVQSFAAAAKATTEAKARTSLSAGEVITVEAQVEEFAEHPGIKDGKEIKYIKARITSPEYVGEVSDLSKSPLWTLDDGLKLTLRGNGKRVFVDKVESATEAVAVTQQPEADEF